MARPRKPATQSALSRFLAMMRHLPRAAEPRYKIHPPNTPLPVYCGPFLLRSGESEWRLMGTIALTWFPHPTLRFRGRVVRGETLRLLENYADWTLTIPAGKHIKAFVTSRTAGARSNISGSLRGALRLGRDRAVRTMRLHPTSIATTVGNSFASRTEVATTSGSPC
jgi:hypothetical protein